MKYDLRVGDSLETLKEFSDNSVEALISDPPGAIRFMNRDWDSDRGGRKEWVAWLASILTECLRVLKPGAYGLVWSIPRRAHWTALACEDAGFEVRDTIVHVQGQGMAQGLNVSESIKSKDLDEEAEIWDGWGSRLKPSQEIWWLMQKPLSEKTITENVLRWGTGAIHIDAARIPTGDSLSGGAATKGNTQGTRHEGWERPWMANDEARAKSVESIKENVAKAEKLGRWPANVVFSHADECGVDGCVEDCPVAELDRQTIGLHPSGNKKDVGVGKDSEYLATSYHMSYAGRANRDFGDQGGASRFFYCAKASTKEKFFYCSLCQAVFPLKDRRRHGPGVKGHTKHSAVFHPTQKPLKLMRYFVKLLTPDEGTVLDPFMGSGSTGVAAKKEGFGFVGIDSDPRFVEIARYRLKVDPSQSKAYWSEKVSVAPEEDQEEVTGGVLDLFL